MKNPYNILGVPCNATDNQIKLAFRQIAKETHPDLNNGNAELTEKFRDAAEAYAFLINENVKMKQSSLYDREFVQNSPIYEDGIHNSRVTAAEIENLIHLMHMKIDECKRAASKSVLTGIAWVLGGVAITYLSYANAVNNGGGAYVVAWGAMLFGGIQAIRSFSNNWELNKISKQIEDDVWGYFGLSTLS